MNENTFVEFILSFRGQFPHCSSLLSTFLFLLFRDNKMHYEIIDRYVNVFFVEIKL